MKLNQDYTYEGETQRHGKTVDQIRLDFTMDFVASEGGPKITVVQQQNDGAIFFDNDEGRLDGSERAALDPFGAGTCLIVAALFVAGPMWRMKLLTVPDFIRRKFGPTAEMISAVILVPSYFGWIAGLFVPLMLGLYSSPRSGRPANVSMAVGTGIWAIHFVMDWEFFLAPLPLFERMQLPLSLSATASALIAYFLSEPPWRIAWSPGIRRLATAASSE